MKIKRKFEILVDTKRQYIIRQSPNDKQFYCEICGEPMLTSELAARFFDIKQRRIFQMIEANNGIHFNESETEAVLVCLASLAKALDDKSQNNQTKV